MGCTGLLAKHLSNLRFDRCRRRKEAEEGKKQKKKEANILFYIIF